MKVKKLWDESNLSEFYPFEVFYKMMTKYLKDEASHIYTIELIRKVRDNFNRCLHPSGKIKPFTCSDFKYLFCDDLKKILDNSDEKTYRKACSEYREDYPNRCSFGYFLGMFQNQANLNKTSIITKNNIINKNVKNDNNLINDINTKIEEKFNEILKRQDEMLLLLKKLLGDKNVG